MIREDRVWQYEGYFYKNENDKGYAYHNIMFRGSVEVNGNVYHAFSLVKKVIYQEISNNEYEFDTEINYDDDGFKYLLREDNGIVYVLYNGGDNGPFRTESKLSDLVFSEEQKSSFYDIEIYNSKVPDGSCVSRRIDSLDTYVEDLKQYYYDPLIIDGESCRQVVYCPKDIAEDGFWDPDFLINVFNGWIEGVGIVGKGHLARHDIFEYAGQFAFSDGEPEHNARLRSVFSLDGRVLYGENPVGSGVEKVNESALSIAVTTEGIKVSGDGMINMAILTLDGREVYSAQGENKISISKDILPKGMYVVTTTCGNDCQNRKIAI